MIIIMIMIIMIMILMILADTEAKGTLKGSPRRTIGGERPYL